MMHRLTALIIAVAVVWTSGCASPPNSYYTLSAVAPVGAPTSTLAPAGVPASTLAVAVGPVSIPADVDRPQIVVSTGPNQARVDEFNRWAGPLQDGIARAVAENLVALLGAPQVTLFPQALSTDAGYRVAIEVQNFDSTLGQSAALDAVWTLRRIKDGKTASGRTRVSEPVQGNGYDVIAAAHSRAIARLSQEIADAVQLLERAPIQASPASDAASGKPGK